jgi:hypothetical protein
MEPIILLIIFLMNIAFLVISKTGALLNIFAIILNFIAFFECSTWFEFFFIAMFSILHSIIVIDRIGG